MRPSFGTHFLIIWNAKGCNKQSSFRKNTVAEYAYKADCDGDWGNIR